LPKEAVGRGDALSYDLVKGLGGVREKPTPLAVDIGETIVEVKRALQRYWKF